MKTEFQLTQLSLLLLKVLKKVSIALITVSLSRGDMLQQPVRIFGASQFLIVPYVKEELMFVQDCLKIVEEHKANNCGS
jgi:hypothetical protein